MRRSASIYIKSEARSRIFSPLPLEGADERSEAGLASPRVKNRIESQPPPLRGTSFQRKEGVCHLPSSSFRAKARNLFRLRSRKDVRRGITGNTVLPTTSSRFAQPTSAPFGASPSKGRREKSGMRNECGEAATLIPHFLETLHLISADFHPRSN